MLIFVFCVSGGTIIGLMPEKYVLVKNIIQAFKEFLVKTSWMCVIVNYYCFSGGTFIRIMPWNINEFCC